MIINKHHKYLISFIFLCFVIAANFAWFNPNPDYKVYKTTETIPFFWQYNDDAAVEIVTSAYFPKIFHTYKTRMERPTYPIISKALGEVFGFVFTPVKKLSKLEKAGAGYVILKLIIFSLFAFSSYHLLKCYLPEDYSLFTVFLLLTHEFSLKSFSLFHTSELQFITPTIVTFFYVNLINKYSNIKNIFFSIIVGILILAKSNYAIYLGILIFSLFNKKFFEVLLSFISHTFPIIIYFFYLKLAGFEFFSRSQELGMGSWIFNSNIVSINTFIELIFLSVFNFLLNFIQHFHVFIIFSILGFFFIDPKKRKSILIFLIILIFFTWFQVFFANRYRSYYSSDLSIFIFGLSSLYFFKFFEKLNLKKNILKFISIIWLTLNLVFILNLPYVHPKDQPTRSKNVQQQRIHMIENFELYDKKLIERNKDGQLLYPENK